MKLTVHKSRISLDAENTLEDELIREWVGMTAQVGSMGTKMLMPSGRNEESIGIWFKPKPETNNAMSSTWLPSMPMPASWQALLFKPEPTYSVGRILIVDNATINEPNAVNHDPANGWNPPRDPLDREKVWVIEKIGDEPKPAIYCAWKGKFYLGTDEMGLRIDYPPDRWKPRIDSAAKSSDEVARELAEYIFGRVDRGDFDPDSKDGKLAREWKAAREREGQR